MDSARSKVLIVEDNPGDVVLLEEAFKEFGKDEFELLQASNFDLAIKLIFKERVEAILLDLSLPLFLGLEPLTRIHKSRPRTPVFVCSGYNDPELASEALRQGAQGYIVKNHLDGGDLVQKVRAAVEHRKKFKIRMDPAPDGIRISP